MLTVLVVYYFQNSRNVFNCPHIGKWLSKLWYIHIVEEYATINNEAYEIKFLVMWKNAYCVSGNKRMQPHVV